MPPGPVSPPGVRCHLKPLPGTDPFSGIRCGSFPVCLALVCIPRNRIPPGPGSDKIVVGGAHGLVQKGSELSQALLPAADSHGHGHFKNNLLTTDRIFPRLRICSCSPLFHLDITNTRLFSSGAPGSCDQKYPFTICSMDIFRKGELTFF